MRRLKIAIGAVVVLVLVGLGLERTAPFGGRSEGARRARIDASPNFSDGKAKNLVEIDLSLNKSYVDVISGYIEGGQEPDVELPLERPVFSVRPADELTVTWLGHSSVVIELDGVRLLTDPVLSERASPFQFMGPKRFHAAPVLVDDLPDVDAVLISHDHYDHLDMQTMIALAEQPMPFVVPLGVGAHLETWGIPRERIIELEWWEETTVKGVRLVCTPARHFSGRGFTDRNQTLFASWAVLGESQRAWFSGDTGPFPQAETIGDTLGPFDLTMIEIGAYDKAWGSVHLGPDAALEMHHQLKGTALFPIHWGTFNLAVHPWDQPIVRLLDIADEAGTPVMVPAAGQTQIPTMPEVHPFWAERARQWRTQDRPTAR